MKALKSNLAKQVIKQFGCIPKKFFFCGKWYEQIFVKKASEK